jgi:hypothetical protein
MTSPVLARLVIPKRIIFCKDFVIKKYANFVCQHLLNFSRNGLCFLDVIIVMLQATMCVEEINLTRDAIRYNVPVIFVRSKMDSIFDDMYHDEKINEKNQETANQVLRECKKRSLYAKP